MAGGERVRKRSSNVCVRCRRQKIKCSGSQPCHSCSKRELPCMFNSMDQKILVSRGYIEELQQKAAWVEKNGRENRSPCHDPAAREAASANETFNPPADPGDSQDMEDSESGLVNTLATDPPAFMSPGNGRTFYLGTSSNWSFTRRVLSLAHRHVHKEALPTEKLTFEGTAYDLAWTDPTREDPIVPSLDHALYLINTVKFRCGQLYHLFDETDFERSLYEFYTEDGRTRTKSLWYIHFLLIVAFGKSLVQSKTQERKPLGMNYLVKALQILPDHNHLYSSPMISTEILCCIALFCQSLDCRSPAHNYVGQAMRMAMAHGMHTRMPVTDLGLHVVERCRKIWWTVYILDRQMTSIQGLPQSIDDRFVQTDLPSFWGSPEKTTTLDMHIKLSRNISEINSMYAIDGRIKRTFLLSTKVALSNIALLADELRDNFPLDFDGTGNGMSRTSAYLHLFYQQCVIVATRPLLFCFLKIRLESPETCVDFLNKSRNVRNLIQACLESAQHSIKVLQGLKSQGLLETFLTFDLESTFISTVVLLIGPATDPLLLHDQSRWLEMAYGIFREMVEAGNEVARFRWSELQQLDETLNAISQSQPGAHTSNTPSQQTGALPQLLSPATSLIPASVDHSSCSNHTFTAETTLDPEYTFNSVLASAEMMAMANSIESYDAEWLSNAIMNHDIW